MPKLSTRLITAEDLYNLETISGLRLSPDGKFIVYAKHRVDRKTQKKYSNLWIIPTSTGKPRQFTSGDQNDSAPQWSPDSQQIAFLSNRADIEKPVQVYLIPISGGEAVRLTEIKGEIIEISWSPDGKKLLMSLRKTDPEELARQEDEKKKKLGVVFRQYDRLFYKLDGYGYLPHERTHVWTVDVPTGRSRQLTSHPVFDELNPSWSPDGKRIAFISNRSQDPDLLVDRDDLFVVPAAGGEFSKIETPPGPKGRPVFSPDGHWIAYVGVDGEDVIYKNTVLWIVPSDGNGPACNLLEKYDLHVDALTINDTMAPEFMGPVWSRDSQSIFFQVVYHGSTLLKNISIRDGSMQDVIGEGGVVGSFSFDRAQAHLAYFSGAIDDPGQVYWMDLASGKSKSLTSLNQSWLPKVDLGRIEELWFKGPDGNDLQGWILTPPGFDPSLKYPSILEIHGGPMLQYGKYFMHEFYYLASHGYVVYFTNPRGGRGYGQDHTRGIYRDWGNKDYIDLMAWSDYVASQPYIDPSRMGVTGGSYGGYMTVWIIGHTQRFNAAVTQRCVSNFTSMWGSSDFNWTFERELNGKPPYEDLQDYWNHSPIAYIGNARTPTLVIHNENDHRCPIEQGEQVFVALKRLGIDTEFVRFPEEFHGLSRTGRTDRRVARLNHILRWFEKYLK
ncbi:MAG TPA: S9 family peptidase [Anaerolineaceae bacterium]|nr:S9 family peptidase [Anaerolineaceae bacterium]